MSDPLAPIRDHARVGTRVTAKGLDELTGGRLTPAMVTWFGFAMHVPVALLIATNHWLWAAGLLIFFGLFDILDGGLAKVQGTTSTRGMMLDASTDRMKEVLLYSGAAYSMALSAHPATAVWATAACGASVCVSYVKAKGEAAVALQEKTSKIAIPHTVLNKMFADGLMTFENRMAILAAGLVFDRLFYAVVAIAVLASFTAFQRLHIISKRLQ